MTTVISERVTHCKSDVCSLWGVLTDTDRMNRAVGMAKVSYAPLNDQSAARFLASTRLGGFAVSYEERPYEWEYLKRFKIFRAMRGGPSRSVEMSTTFATRADGGTDV